MTEGRSASVTAFRTDQDEWTRTRGDSVPAAHHLFECVLDGSYHQALVLDLLLAEEARRRRGAGRGAGRTRGPAQRSGPGQCSVGAGGVSLEVGVAVGLLPQQGGRRGGQVAQDLDHGLELAGDVVLQHAGGDNRCAGTSVAIEQGPVVEHQPFTVLQRDKLLAKLNVIIFNHTQKLYRSYK